MEVGKFQELMDYSQKYGKQQKNNSSNQGIIANLENGMLANRKDI